MKIIVGIDPDIDKSGFAVWNSHQQSFVEITALPFFDLIERLEWLGDVTVVVEAGWLIKKSNFHGRKGQSKAVGEKIAKAVGANHQVGKLLVEWCRSNNIDVVEIKPLGKVDSDKFKMMTGWHDRTNSEHRDAAMLVFGR